MSRSDTERDPLGEILFKTISVAEASTLSGLSTSWLRHLLIRREIEGIKVGRDWRLTREALQAYLDRERRPGPKGK